MLSGVESGVDPTQTPGWHPPLGRLLPPLPAQPDMARPSRMIAQTPIVAENPVMMFASLL